MALGFNGLREYPEIFVIGDSHGNTLGENAALKAAGLLKNGRICVPENTLLVRTGDDGADRFPYARPLRAQIPDEQNPKEGDLITLAGNHDAMEVYLRQGDPIEVLPGQYLPINQVNFSPFLGFLACLPPEVFAETQIPQPGEVWSPDVEEAVLNAIYGFAQRPDWTERIHNLTTPSDRRALMKYDLAATARWRGTNIIFTHTPITDKMVHELLAPSNGIQALNHELRRLISAVLDGTLTASDKQSLNKISHVFFDPDNTETDVSHPGLNLLEKAGVGISVHGHTHKRLARDIPGNQLSVFTADRKACNKRANPNHRPKGHSFLYFSANGQVYEGDEAVQQAANRS